MKNTAKKILVLIICVLLISLNICIPSLAAETPVVTLSQLTAIPGDTIALEVKMSNNPGIMAMTFTVSYDTEALDFVKYRIGIWNDYTIVNHTDKGYVSFVNCETLDRKYNGTIFTLFFTVKENASPEYHPFKVMNINPEKYGEDLKGCFADWNHNSIMPTVKNGGVTVGKTCSNSGHTYGEFKTTINPTCTEKGVESRSCTVCGHTEIKDIKPQGHSFEDNWTVDRAATAEQQGIMSRHCKNCGAVTDKVYFSLKESNDNKLPNKQDSSVTTKDWDKLEKIEKEQDNVEGEPTDSSKNPDKLQNAGDLVSGTAKASSVWRYFLGDGENKGFFVVFFRELKNIPFIKFLLSIIG